MVYLSHYRITKISNEASIYYDMEVIMCLITSGQSLRTLRILKVVNAVGSKSVQCTKFPAMGSFQ
jgi:hypothetical protein